MDINIVGVIGAGQMGGGIAQVAAQAGFQVVLLDMDEASAQRGKDAIAKRLGRDVQKERLSQADCDATLERLSVAGDYSALANADIVIEAATEQAELKEKIFRAADAAMKDGAILASNTSSLSLTRLAGVTKRPEDVIGMHFMNPVPRMKLVEIVLALQTSEATHEATKALSEKLGKTVVNTKDMPGFIVNRLLIPFLNEACFALQEGLGSVEEIDAAIKLGLNHPMGPCALADLIGLDTVLFIAEVLHREFGEDKYRPAPLLRNYVNAGWLGRKSGRGFYNYGEK